ncbi:ATP-binding cassette sub-family A member 13 [Ambystoma mexicanum]|uniref:ATP-binding cassette sub-family A member 13 n=1 Tax=Ambystoma mexicanum TaxID=8296 RepID=UPI0037E97F8D
MTWRAVLENYSKFLENVVNFPDRSLLRAMTTIKEILKTEKEAQLKGDETMVFMSTLVEYMQQIFHSNDSLPLSTVEMQALLDNILNNAAAWINSFSGVDDDESDPDFKLLSEFIHEILDRVNLISSLWPEEQHSEVFWQMLMSPIFSELELPLHNPFVSGNPQKDDETDILKDLLLTFAAFSSQKDLHMLNTSLIFFETFLSDVEGLSTVEKDKVYVGELFINDLCEIGLLDQAHADAVLGLINFVKNASANTSSSEMSSQMKVLEEMLNGLHHGMPEETRGTAVMLLEILATIHYNADGFMNIHNNGSLVGVLFGISEVMSHMLRQLDLPAVMENMKFLDGSVSVLQNLSNKSLCEQIFTVYSFLEQYAQHQAQKGHAEMQIIYQTLLGLKNFSVENDFHIVAFRYLNQLFDSAPGHLLNFHCTEYGHANSTPMSHSAEVYGSSLQGLAGVFTNISSHMSQGQGNASLCCLLTWFQMGAGVLEEMSLILSMDPKCIPKLQMGLVQLKEELHRAGNNQTCAATFFAFNNTASFARNFLTILANAPDFKLWKDFKVLGHFMRTISNTLNATSSIPTDGLTEAINATERMITGWQNFMVGVNKSSNLLDHTLDIVMTLSSQFKSLDSSMYSLVGAFSNILRSSGSGSESTLLNELKEVTGFLNNTTLDRDMQFWAELFKNITQLVAESHKAGGNKAQPMVLAAINTMLDFSTKVDGVLAWNRWKQVMETVGELHDSFSNHTQTEDLLTFLTHLMSTNSTDSMLKNSWELIYMAFNVTALSCPLHSSDMEVIAAYLRTMSHMSPLINSSFKEESTAIIQLILTLVNNTDGKIETIIHHLSRYLQYVGHMPGSDSVFSKKLINQASNISRWLHEIYVNHRQLITEFLKQIPTFLNKLSPNIWTKNVTSGSIEQLLSALENSSKMKNQTLGQILEGSDLKSLLSEFEQVFMNLSRLLVEMKASTYAHDALVRFSDWLKPFKDESESWNLNTTSPMSELFEKLNFRNLMHVILAVPEGISLLEGMHHKNITESFKDMYRFTRSQESLMSAFSKHDPTNMETLFLQLLVLLIEMPVVESPVYECLLAFFYCNQTESALSDTFHKAHFSNCSAEGGNASSGKEQFTDLFQRIRLTLPHGEFQCPDDPFLRELADKGSCFFHQFEEWSLLLANLSEAYHVNCSSLGMLSEVWGKLSHVLPPKPLLNPGSCLSNPVTQAASKLSQILHHMQATPMTANDTLNLIFYAMSLHKSAYMPLLNESLSILKTMTNIGDKTKRILPELLVTLRPVLTLFPVVGQMHALLPALSAMYTNPSLVEGFKNMWLEMNRTMSMLMPDLNLHLLLSEITETIEFSKSQLPTSPLSLPNILKLFNATFLETSLLRFDKCVEASRNWTSEGRNATYAELLNDLICLWSSANKSESMSPFVKDLVDMFQLISQSLKEEHRDDLSADLPEVSKLMHYFSHFRTQRDGHRGRSASTQFKDTHSGMNESREIEDLISDLVWEGALYEYEALHNDTLFSNKTLHLLKQFVQLPGPPTLRESELEPLMAVLRETYKEYSTAGISVPWVLFDALSKFLYQKLQFKSDEQVFQQVNQDLTGDDDFIQLRSIILGIVEMFSNQSLSFSPNETHAHLQGALDEYWQEGQHNNQSFLDLCQYLKSSVDPVHAKLLQKMQSTALSITSLLAENPSFTKNSDCMLRRCKGWSTRRFLFSLIEGINLIGTQHQDITVSPPSVDADCASFYQTNGQLSSMIDSVKQSFQDVSDSCQCGLSLESTQPELHKLETSLSDLLSRNPAIAFWKSVSVPSDMKIRDCVQNVTALESEIHALMNISDRTVGAIFEATLSPSKFLYSALTIALVDECNKDVLGLLLKLPEGADTPLAVEELCSLTTLELYELGVLISQHLDVRKIIYKMKIPPEVNTLLTTLLDVVTDLNRLLGKIQHVLQNLPGFLKALQNIPLVDITEFQQLLGTSQSRRSTFGSLHSLIMAVCKEESNFFSNDNMFNSMPQITDILKKDMDKYSIPEDSTPFCLQFYQDILQSPSGALVWTFLKPLLHGQILYAPNIPEIRLVMDKANTMFDLVKNLKIYSESWLSMSQIFQNSERFLMVNELQAALQNSFIRNFVESQLNIDLKKFIEKLQEYGSRMNQILNSTVTQQVNMLSQLMVNISSCVRLDRFQPFNSTEELEVKAHELMQQNNFLASIIFNVSSRGSQEDPNSTRPLPPHVTYTIRTSVLYSMKTESTKNAMWKSHPQGLPAAGFAYNHVFAPLQDMVERAIIAVQTGTDALAPEVQVQAMPYPCHTSDLFLTNIGFFFPLIMMLTWMISVASMVRKLVHEKEIRLEEYMKMMGVHPTIHFLAWLLENVIVLAISSITLVLILKLSGVLFHSNILILFVYFLDFGIAVIMMSYLMSAFFSHANTACLCASLIYMISFLPYIVLLVLQKQFSFTTQTIVCLLSTTAFGQGIFMIIFFEGQNTGIQWSNLYEPLEQTGAMTFGWASAMIFIDSIIYFVIGWYLSNVIPGKYGLAKPWYFPFTGSYWKNLCGREIRRKHYLNSNMALFNENLKHKGYSKQDQAGTGQERILEGLQVGVDLMSVTKEYDGNKMAVNNLNLSFFKGHITALLGPNGAGKTTIISMLTGLYPPSQGTILVNGKDTHTQLPAIRLEMGVCPQYDVLFETLTVWEHLLLYGTAKAPFLEKKVLHQEVKRAIRDVGLGEHKNKYVRALSGGMKRRLSIAIAFLGDSKTVVLDEPTSGVDPCSRRSIWELLLKYKTGRTIIFTTHHLDEAEVLSDRIAILQNGQLRCCGSPRFLKDTYGQGHSITLTRKPSMLEIQDPEMSIQTTTLVQAYIPNAFLKEKSSTELTYVIPVTADKTAFEGLFQALDEHMHLLHLTGYGISDTTLEEIFLKLMQHPEEQVPIHLGVDLENSQFCASEPTCHNDNSLVEAGSMQGGRLVLTQITSLLIKRFHHARRDWRGALSNLVLPVVFVTMAMALFNLKPLTIDFPLLKLSPELYDDDAGACFYSADTEDSANLSQTLLRVFVGHDSPCSSHGNDAGNVSCWQMEQGTEQPITPCSCVKDQQKCPVSDMSSPYLKNSRGQVLYNLSGLDFEEYLIKPLKKERYGGWSFGMSTGPRSEEKHPNKTQAKVWYNHKGFHGLPSYLNQMNNMLLWTSLPPTVDWRQYGITLYSQPYGGSLLDEDKILENVRQCGVALCIMLGFSILTASIGSSVVKDRVSGAKRLQHIAGLKYEVYWIANFLYDMLFYLVPVGLSLCIIAAFQLTAFTFRENLAASALLLILFGYATLPWMYLISRFFSSSDVAFITYISINFIFGLCTLLLTLLPRLLSVMSKSEKLTHVYMILRWVFLIFPQFCLGQGLMELSYNQVKFDLTSSFGIDSYVSPFQLNVLGWIFVAMALQGSMLLLLRVLLHWDCLQKHQNWPSVHSIVNPSGDRDVEAERLRVFSGHSGNDILTLYNLRKCYQRFNKKTVAVNDISLGIPRGECFGLLGVNGAGKSTTFKMLTADITPTAGQAVIRTPSGSERDILTASTEGTLIGYCPQQDALDELLTGWEHLHYYCRLRGIATQYIHKVSRDLVSRLHLGSHADKLVKTYSGGTKRKLSTALALVGKPQILLLDEPSSGMDPCSKRYLWNTILKEVQEGCAAVLTSHSMEECEALCSRLAIMVNGSFKCLGSPQHIKNRFGEGYSVKVWLAKDTSCPTAVSDCLNLHFPGTCFKEQHLNLLEYRVPQRKGCLAELFKTLESNKLQLQIEHYSINQTTLEQVFINFAAQSQEASGCVAGPLRGDSEQARYVLS